MIRKKTFGTDISNVSQKNPAYAGKQTNLVTNKPAFGNKENHVAQALKPAMKKTELPPAVSQASVFQPQLFQSSSSSSSLLASQSTVFPSVKPTILQQAAQPSKTIQSIANTIHLDTSYEDDSESEDAMLIDQLANNSLDDIDRYDHNDPQFVSEYINDIIAFLKEKEIEQQKIIPFNYCDQQKDFKSRHRDQLVRWMAEVYVQLKLFSETYFLAVNIVDQVLAKGPILRKKLHLIGVTALFVASKYEETWAPPLNDFRICCDFIFTEAEILSMESSILNRIDFNLSVPFPLPFLRRYSKAAYSDSVAHTMGKFITEMTCQNYCLLEFVPSQIAAASVLITRQIIGATPLWNSNLKHYSGYEKDDIVRCANLILQVLQKEYTRNANCAIIKKYSEKKCLCVSTLVFQKIISH